LLSGTAAHPNLSGTAAHPNLSGTAAYPNLSGTAAHPNLPAKRDVLFVHFLGYDPLMVF